MYSVRENVEAGGLMSYGANYPDLFRRAAELVDKILRGTKPSEIPVEQPTRFDLVINLITARVLGLTIPETLLATADEVDPVKRREFIAGLGSAVAWPLAARAQQPAIPVIGYLSPGTQEAGASRVAEFRTGLSQAGYVEGRNVAIEYRWAENRL
jgi:hypothetical protein